MTAALVRAWSGGACRNLKKQSRSPIGTPSGNWFEQIKTPQDPSQSSEQAWNNCFQKASFESLGKRQMMFGWLYLRKQRNTWIILEMFHKNKERFLPSNLLERIKPQPAREHGSSKWLTLWYPSSYSFFCELNFH